MPGLSRGSQLLGLAGASTTQLLPSSSVASDTDGEPAMVAVGKSALDAVIDQLQDTVMGCKTGSNIRTAGGRPHSTINELSWIEV
jgi:hypothetical protein